MMSGDGLPSLLTIIYFHSSVAPLRESGLRNPIRVSNTTYWMMLFCHINVFMVRAMAKC